MARTPGRSRSGPDAAFDDPPGPTGAATAPDIFEPPPGEDPSAVADQPVLAAAGRADAELMGMKAELERMIFARPAAAEVVARGLRADRPEAAELITGVGIGPAMRDFESVGPAGPGAPVLNIYVVEPMGMEEAKAAIVDSYGIRPLTSDQRPVNVIHTGPIDAFAHRHRERPAPCGISVAHVRVTAGTLGVLARGRSAPRQNRLLMLSNNHVLANSNDAQAGDPILQPGAFDGGVEPADRIAVLEQWVPIDFAAGAVNHLDCATGWCWPDRVRKEFIYRSGGAWAYFRVASSPTAAAVGMAVGKSGRTTQLTSGQVIDVNASIRVNYGGGRVANFRDQIAVRGNSGLFSQGGDSGSLIWTWDSQRRPVGLLFAGGGQITFANGIEMALAALDLALYV